MSEIIKIIHLASAPITGRSPVKLVLENGSEEYTVWDNTRVLAWRAKHGDDAATAYVAPPVSVDQVVAERTRRLALGFDYDFGDERGVHRIGTTKSDLEGWDEVTKIAQAAINLGAPGTVINIVTDTGPVTLTASEWQGILVAAGQARQPLWAKSFELQAMERVPADYNDDRHWLTVVTA